MITRRATLGGLLSAPLCASSNAAPGGIHAAMVLADQIAQLHSIAISQGGTLMAAEALRGPSLDTPVNVKSVSKTLVSALCGVALARGEIPSVDAPVHPYLGRVIPRRADKRVKQITFAHLMTMQSGLTPFAGRTYGAWVSGDHWIYEALSAPMQADPGTERLYSTANTHILGAALADAAGKSLLELANERLGDPLDLSFRPWTADPQGNYLGGNDMRMAPMGMLRFGEAYLQGGTWTDERLVPPSWVAASWTPRTMADIPGHSYGYSWFIWNAGGVTVNYARGYGGQMIYVVPARGLVVAMTSDTRKPALMDGHLGVLHALFEGAILPAFS